jgi:hypothetical protein
VHVTDAAVTTVTVTTTIAPALAGFTAAEAQAGVTAVNAFLDPQTWTIGEDVMRRGAAGRDHRHPGSVDYMVSLSAPATVTIAADAVAQYGTITVSVT